MPVTESCRCMSLEAKDIFASNHRISVENGEYDIRKADGTINLRKFTNTFDWSLDAIKLSEVYEKKARRKDFAFRVGRYLYTKNVVCVTFKYSYKEFNMVGKNIFVRDGYVYKDCVMDDGICIKDGQLVAVQTNVEVQHPVSQEVLGKYFTYSNGYYVQDGSIPTILDKAALRKELYENGFRCDGVEYVRYKRSSGSSRVGKCLFVNKLLAEEMAKWDKCGLDIKEDQPIDLAAWEAYISLPMSSIIDTVNIPLDSILIIDDYNSEFEDDVVAVSIDNNHLASAEQRVKISNSIFDGQSLMDKSVFGKYEDKGMLLLRNRFFKSCCFNTNIQEWFADMGITSVDQLKGITLATDISQIKLITTPSSIKYMKFGNVVDWLKTVDPTFGIVKYEKQPHPFDGKMVQAHYQLFNTLQLSIEEMDDVLKPSLKYLYDIRRDPAVLRHKINYPDVDDEEWSSLESKNEIVFKLLGITDKFAHTKMYYDFRDDLIKSEIRNLKRGHVLVHGNYSTLLGNGFEMLKASIGTFDGSSELGVGNIHTKRFEYGKTLLCSRSPHVTVGNILLTTNVENADYDKYFNLTTEIVCINAIGENIQQRLNGCDYDSDTMLITDNELLIAAAKKNYDRFKVPTNMISSIKTARKYNQLDKADLDVKTSVNKIGEIINLSQQLNSLMWERMNKGCDIRKCMDLYMDICKLAVLSNVEIDRAKKEFVINSMTEINILKMKYKLTDDGKTVKPMFFKMITLENGYKLSDSIKYRYFNTSMDYLQKIISKFNFREGRECKRTLVKFTDIIKEPDMYIRHSFYYAQKENILNAIRSARDERKKLFIDYDSMSKDEKQYVLAKANEMRQECVEEVMKMSSSRATMYLVLREIDNPENRDLARFIFEVLFGRPDQAFFEMIKESREDVYTLVEDNDGDIEYYGVKFTKKKIEIA